MAKASMGRLIAKRQLGIASLVLFLVAAQLTNHSVRNPSFGESPAALVSEVLQPLQSLQHEGLASFRYFRDRYLWLVSVASERDFLSQRIVDLEAVNSKLLENRYENSRLKKLLQFTETAQIKGQLATVIGRDTSNWVKSITINRGSVHGLRSGLAVVSGNALIGRTTRVSPSSAKVLLMTDHASAIDALIQETRVSGIIEGAGASALRLSYVENKTDASVEIGQRVIASGLDGVFPKGVLIGVVSAIDTDATSLFQTIQVKAHVDFSQLEDVLVLLPEQEQKPSSFLEGMRREEAYSSEARRECSVFAGA